MTLWGKFENLNKKINLKLGLFMIQNGVKTKNNLLLFLQLEMILTLRFY